MKKFTLLTVTLCLLLVAGGLQAQVTSGTRDQAGRFLVSKPTLNHKGNEPIGQMRVNPTVAPKAVLDDTILMITRYDEQTNASTENRTHLFSDGTVGAVSMLSHNDSYADRGTGTNFYDGTDWGPQPSARIESTKSGWPSYAPWGPDGEIVVDHHMTAGLYVMTRATKGTGAWNEAILPGPAGAVDISWPRVVTNGPDHTYIHIICLTYSAYQGLDLALLYYRSLDGGATWDYQHRIIEGLTSADYLGFSADIYAWAEPKGDTLAFAFCDAWMDLAIMKSYNNGDDWEKIVVWPSQYNTTPITGDVETFYAPDGTIALALDQYGKAHVASGMMYSAASAGSKQWVPQSDGLLYWNEDMPQLPEVLVQEDLLASGNLIGRVADTVVLDTTSTLVAFYYNSMTSQPTITVDNDDAVFVTWAGVTTLADPDNFLLRHIYARGSSDYGNSWTISPVDLTSDYIQYNWSECVFPSTSWASDDYLYITFQEDDYAGSYVQGSSATGYQGQTGPTDNRIRFIRPSKMDILFPLGTGKEKEDAFDVSQNFPNPATDQTSVRVQLSQPGNVSLTVTTLTGQVVETLSKGSCTTGSCSFTINTRGLTPGLYFYTVTFRDTKVTRKMVVD